MTGYPLSDFWRVADAETVISRCAGCTDALTADELRRGSPVCTICELHPQDLPVENGDGSRTVPGPA